MEGKTDHNSVGAMKIQLKSKVSAKHEQETKSQFSYMYNRDVNICNTEQV